MSLYEKRFTTKSKLKPFEDEIMPYTDSLQQAITTLENKLNTSDTPFNQQSLACLEALKTDYARQYKINFD